jgi:hypothetical protein
MEIKFENKLKAVAQYLGQKIRLDESRFSEETEDRIFTLSGVGINAFQVKETRIWYNAEEIRSTFIDELILRPLSSVSEDELMDCLKIMLGDDWEKDSEKFKQDWRDVLRIELSQGGYGKWVVKPYFKHCLFVYQYLQSKGYDVPNQLLGGKTMYESGLAVYE